jgi:hypothetical protein
MPDEPDEDFDEDELFERLLDFCDVIERRIDAVEGEMLSRKDTLTSETVVGAQGAAEIEKSLMENFGDSWRY